MTNNRKYKLLLFVDAFVVNIATYAFMGILWLAMNLSPMFSGLSHYLKDFDFTDLYFSEIRKESQSVSQDIFIVNTGLNSNIELAQQINILQKFNPKVIAIEQVLQKTDEFSDFFLKNTLDSYDNIVLACSLIYDEIGLVTDVIFPDKYFGSYNTGNIEFKTTPRTIREFNITNKFKDSLINSFTVETVKKISRKHFESLINHRENIQTINYNCGQMPFIVFDYEDINYENENLSIIENKIVLLGYVKMYEGAALDTLFSYFTPIKKSEYGYSDFKRIEIHAHILNMILNESYITKTPFWLNTLIAFLISYIFLILLALYYKTGAKYFDIVAKPAMFIMIVLNLWITIIIFGKFNIKIDLVLASIALVICIELFRFYEETLLMLRIRSYVTEFHNFDEGSQL